MNYNYYQYLMPKNPALIQAWHARRDAEGVMHAPLLRLLMWGDTSVRMVQHKDRSTRSAIACSFRGEDADRLWREAGEVGTSVREYVTNRICDALGIPRHEFTVKRPASEPSEKRRARAERRRAATAARPREPKSGIIIRRERERGRRGWAAPTQPAGGPYWPNPGMRDESRAAG